MTTIRAITLALGDPHPLTEDAIARATAFLTITRARMEEAGHTVQTTRVATRPMLQDLDGRPAAEITAYAASLQRLCEAHGLGYLSLGPAPAHQPTFPLEHLRLLVDALAPNAALSASAQLAYGGDAPRYDAALAVAGVMRDLAEASAGEANFRFAMLAMCEPGGPFFPQAYARGRAWSISVGLQTAGLIGETLATTRAASADCADPLALLPRMEQDVRRALAAEAAPITRLLAQSAGDAGFTYGGVDLSPAPMGAESIAAAMERAELGHFGSAGTLALAATLTAAIKAAAEDVAPSCGYNGLMLPVLEDETLGKRGAEGRLTITSLLAWSAVCGTGLDTIPLPGDAAPEQVAHILGDVAALAWRLRKPLSARLFLTPGGSPGEMTHFTSPYLTNTRILSL